MYRIGLYILYQSDACTFALIGLALVDLTDQEQLTSSAVLL